MEEMEEREAAALELEEMLESIIDGIHANVWPVPFVIEIVTSFLASIIHTTAANPYASMNNVYVMLAMAFHNLIENHDDQLCGYCTNVEKRKKNKTKEK